MERLDRITVDPGIALGQPTIRGMRITVGMVLKMLAYGNSAEQTLKAYPELEPEDIRQCLAYAAWLVTEQVRLAPAG
jgi:uncharacterized protein (DUF433 family)